jgi:hypothetical protein
MALLDHCGRIAGLVVIWVIADIGQSAQNDANDPERHVGAVN